MNNLCASSYCNTSASEFISAGPITFSWPHSESLGTVYIDMHISCSLFHHSVHGVKTLAGHRLIG